MFRVCGSKVAARVVGYFGSGGSRLGFGLGVVGRVRVRGKLGFLFGLG